MTDALGFLGSPYTHPDSVVAEERYIAVSRVAGKLMMAGFQFFCPISHGHPMSVYGGVPKFDHDLWRTFNRPWWDICDELWIVTLRGWEQSEGLKDEYQYFYDQGKPVYKLDPEDPVGSLGGRA